MIWLFSLAAGFWGILFCVDYFIVLPRFEIPFFIRLVLVLGYWIPIFPFFVYLALDTVDSIKDRYLRRLIKYFPGMVAVLMAPYMLHPILSLLIIFGVS